MQTLLVRVTVGQSLCAVLEAKDVIALAESVVIDSAGVVKVGVLLWP